MTFHYESIAVYSELGGALRLARGVRAFTTDPTTGAAVNATQGARVAPYVDADAAGDVSFTAESWPVRLTNGATYEDVFPVETPQMLLDAVAAAEAAEAGATAPTDVVMAAKVDDPASLTRGVLDGTFAPVGEPVALTKVTTTDRPVSLQGQPGIDWTGATDSAATVQAVITAAGVGAKIDMGKGGRIRCDTGLTLLDFQTLEGPIFQLGTGTPALVEFDFSNLTGAAVGITCGASNVISNVLLRGPGYTAATQIGVVNTASGSPEFDHVQFYSWPTAVKLTTSYYTIFNRCEWMYNAVGVQSVGCTNLNFYAPRFRCRNLAATAWGSALILGVDNYPVNIHGGSLEDYQTGITVGVRSQINLYGVYFESGSTASPIGIQANSVAGASLALYGCGVYMQGHGTWVSLGGNALSQSLTASGNKFVATTASTTTPSAYSAASGFTGEVNLSGDNWAGVAKGNYYTGTATLPRSGCLVVPPFGAPDADVFYLGLAKLVQQAAQANTTGATLAALETEVNSLKAKMRTLGLMA